MSRNRCVLTPVGYVCQRATTCDWPCIARLSCKIRKCPADPKLYATHREIHVARIEGLVDPHGRTVRVQRGSSACGGARMARGGRSAPSAVTLERHPCLPLGRWPVGAAARKLFKSGAEDAVDRVRVRAASMAR